MRRWILPPLAVVLILPCVAPALAVGGKVLVRSGTSTRYLANARDPKIGTKWVQPEFDDSAWKKGRFGIGRETTKDGGALALLSTLVPANARSIYTRTRVTLDDPSTIENLFLGVDYDDGFALWINGREIVRARTMPAGKLDWDVSPESHESSNGLNPLYGPLLDVSEKGLPLLKKGVNVIAFGVWDNGRSSDLVLVPHLAADQPEEIFVTRGPYLQLPTPTSMLVRWRTNKPTTSRVVYGSAPDKLDRVVTDEKSTTEHRVTLAGLQPDSRYYYMVGTRKYDHAGADSDHFFRTSPAPGSRIPFRIWVIGDSGTGGYRARKVRDGYEIYSGGGHTSVWLMLGDNAYPEGNDWGFQRAMFNIYGKLLARTPVWSTVGNHDNVESFVPPVGPIYDVFDSPTRGESGGVPSGSENFYSFDFANAHFVAMNSELPREHWDRMIDWLKRDLAATKMGWVIAFWHHSPYGRGRHESDRSTTATAMRQRVMPILDAEGVDLALTGHIHAYSRSYLLRGYYGKSGSFKPEYRLDAGDGQVRRDGAYRKPPGRTPNNGIVYVMVGCSGEAVETNLEHPAYVVGLKVTGSLSVEIDGDRLEARFIDSQGRIRDGFTILKEGRPATAARAE